MGRFDRAGRGYEYVTNAKSCEKADLVVAARDCERDFRPDRFLRFKNDVYARRERHGYGGVETFTAMSATQEWWLVLIQIIGVDILAPAVICLLISEFMRKMGWIKFGDLKLDL